MRKLRSKLGYLKAPSQADLRHGSPDILIQLFSIPYNVKT